jgi:ACS family hexuronate transporter-like MFS transporter
VTAFLERTASVAIAISYLDRQTLPWAIKSIKADIPMATR